MKKNQAQLISRDLDRIKKVMEENRLDESLTFLIGSTISWLVVIYLVYVAAPYFSWDSDKKRGGGAHPDNHRHRDDGDDGDDDGDMFESDMFNVFKGWIDRMISSGAKRPSRQSVDTMANELREVPRSRLIQFATAVVSSNNSPDKIKRIVDDFPDIVNDRTMQIAKSATAMNESDEESDQVSYKRDPGMFNAGYYSLDIDPDLILSNTKVWMDPIISAARSAGYHMHDIGVEGSIGHITQPGLESMLYHRSDIITSIYFLIRVLFTNGKSSVYAIFSKSRELQKSTDEVDLQRSMRDLMINYRINEGDWKHFVGGPNMKLLYNFLYTPSFAGGAIAFGGYHDDSPNYYRGNIVQYFESGIKTFRDKYAGIVDVFEGGGSSLPTGVSAEFATGWFIGFRHQFEEKLLQTDGDIPAPGVSPPMRVLAYTKGGRPYKDLAEARQIATSDSMRVTLSKLPKDGNGPLPDNPTSENCLIIFYYVKDKTPDPKNPKLIYGPNRIKKFREVAKSKKGGNSNSGTPGKPEPGDNY